MARSQESTRGQEDFTSNAKVQHDNLSNAADSDGDDLAIGPRATYITTGAAAGLSQEHRDYLIKRHGTLDLDPIPSDDPADPYNWPGWKKMANLMVVGFNAMMTTFTAAAIIPAYEAIAEEFECSITRASYLTSLQIMVLGWSPLFWKPLSQRYGRRPIWLISMLGSLLFNVGCALSHSYSTMAICRAFVSFFLCPAMAYGSGVVTETYFKKQRAQYMGVWTLLVTLGAPSGPFIMGFVSYQTGNYRWIYWTLAIINGVHFVAYILFGPETRYIRRGVAHRGSAFSQEYLQFRRIDPSPLRIYEFIQPLSLARYPSIVIPSIAYAVVFCFSSVLLTVEIPQLFIPKFAFNSQQIGLQFLGIIIGSIIGEQLGGRLSDIWMRRIGGRREKAPAPEFRLWLSYGGFLLAIVGLIVFGACFENAEKNHWNVTPIVGIAIAAVGNQIVTTVLVTYAVDCHIEHSASIGIFVNVVRQTWAFIGPFFFPDMLSELGTLGAVGLLAGLIFIVCWIPTAALQWQGQKWRDARPQPVVETEKVEVDEKEKTSTV